MREDVAAIHAQQQAIGYESVFIEGAAESERYMKGLVLGLARTRHHLGPS